MAELGTQLAHVDGGVPNMRLIVPELNEYYLGAIIYFFEKACGISGYLPVSYTHLCSYPSDIVYSPSHNVASNELPDSRE